MYNIISVKTLQLLLNGYFIYFFILFDIGAQP